MIYSIGISGLLVVSLHQRSLIQKLFDWDLYPACLVTASKTRQEVHKLQENILYSVSVQTDRCFSFHNVFPFHRLNISVASFGRHRHRHRHRLDIFMGLIFYVTVIVIVSTLAWPPFYVTAKAIEWYVWKRTSPHGSVM